MLGVLQFNFSHEQVFTPPVSNLLRFIEHLLTSRFEPDLGLISG